jgi:uncharacterized alkaline shock family protein YloU
MRFFTRLAILFYVATISVLCGFAILFVSQMIFWQDVERLLQFAYSDMQSRMIIGLAAGVLILLSFMFARIILGRQQRERTIAFDNPAGRVTISLTAMEDLIRRVITRSPEVKEIRPRVVANKRGLDVGVRLVLRSDSNIPEITSKLQEMIRSKVQDTIGIDGVVSVRVDVVKIVPEDGKSRRERRDQKEGDESSKPTVPFSGYGV